MIYLAYEITPIESGVHGLYIYYKIVYRGDTIAAGWKNFRHKRSVKRGMNRLAAALGIKTIFEVTKDLFEEDEVK